MRPRAVSSCAGCRNLLPALLLVVPVLVAACGSESPPAAPASSASASASASANAAGAIDARAQIAALAALAQDRSLTALYTLSVSGEPERKVRVTRAADRSWRIDIPSGALGGTVDVAIAENSDGIYQCALPSATHYLDAMCVRVGRAGSALASHIDPRVQHAFTDWQEVLTDRQAPLSVSTASPPPGIQGICFSVESISASLNPPLDVGIYCYDESGTPTGAKLGFGTLVLAGAPAAAPATIALPGPVVDREPLNVGGAPEAATGSSSTATAAATSTGA